MLFNTFQFAIFFAAILLLYRELPQRGRNRLLLGASLLFYTLWVPAYLLLLLADIVVNYALLRGMVRSSRPRLFLAGSVVFTLGLLGFFKYAGFLVETALPVLEQGFGIRPPIPEVFLPLGISFYSFQILALAIDTYRGQAAPVQSLSQYALFISFFPQLIAGPILRGRELLPQLERGGRVCPERTRRGMWLIGAGLAKKVILADFLLSSFVDELFITPGVANAPFHLIGAYSFAFQIYFDFSGYTDMARGLACLLGYEIPLNFTEPYLSRNPAEFWRRWHITLSRWLRDYLYISLGGNRRGSARTHANLMITMLLGGLWHGAAWTFVIWGGLHGVLLVLHRLVGRSGDDDDAPLSFRDVPRVFLMFSGVALLLVIFRAPTVSHAGLFLGALFTGGYWLDWPAWQTLVVLLCVGLHVLERFVRLRLPRIQEVFTRAWWGLTVEAAVLGTLVGLVVVVSGSGDEFIYFQF